MISKREKKTVSSERNSPWSQYFEYLLRPPVFVIVEVGIWHPDFLGEIPRQRENIISVTEGQPLVLPILIQVHRDRIILQTKDTWGQNRDL